MDTVTPQKPKRQYRKSGYYRTLQRLRGRGINGIDKRTGPGKDALTFRDEAVTDLGGDSNITSTKKALLDIATMQRYLFRFGVEYILSLDAPVNKRKKAFFPIVKDIVSLSDSLAKHLITLGLDRVLPPPKTLADYMSEIQEEEANAGTASNDSPTQGSLPRNAGDEPATGSVTSDDDTGKDNGQ